MVNGLVFDQLIWIGKNRYGYHFGCGLERGRWLGFALGPMDGTERFMMLFHEVSDDVTIGMADRDQAVALTSAIAADPDANYGGVDEWLIPEAMRGDLEKLRCQECGGCGWCACKEEWDEGRALIKEHDPQALAPPPPK
jgi:hypothetical protein